VGASSILIEIGGRRALVDAGIRPTPKARWRLAGDQLPDLSYIERSGGLDTILVTDGYLLVDGLYRLRAAQAVGLERVAAIVDG